MQGVATGIVKWQVAHFSSCDPECGLGVVTRMGSSSDDRPKAKAVE